MPWTTKEVLMGNDGRIGIFEFAVHWKEQKEVVLWTEDKVLMRNSGLIGIYEYTVHKRE